MNEAFVRHLERASEIVSTWPEWKQNLLGRRTMNQVDQAARRAAELVLDLDCECKECEAKTVEAETIIAAEFAPLRERLVEAERLLGRAMTELAVNKIYPKQLMADVVALAAKPTDPPKESQ